MTLRTGRIAVNYRSDLLLFDENHQLWPAVCKRSVGRAACGDTVLWKETAEGQASIEKIEPRHGELTRPNSRGKMQTIAANLDQLIIVSAVVPFPSNNLIDRYLIAANHFGLEPVVVFNKTDLLDDENRDAFDDIVAIYYGLDVKVLFTHVRTNEGISELVDTLKGKTSALVGLSGVGKSSITKLLLPEEDIRIGEISEVGQEGKHTTTATRLYRIPSGGYLVDSPGVRQFRIYHLDETTVKDGFGDIAALSHHCRFANCTHQKEPQCAVKTAAENGLLHPARYESYLQILQGMGQRY